MAPTRFTAAGWFALIGAAACLGLLCAGCGTKKGPPAGKTPEGTQVGPGPARQVGVPREEYGKPVDGLCLAVDWRSAALSKDRCKLKIPLSVRNAGKQALWVPAGLVREQRFVQCFFFDQGGKRIPFSGIRVEYPALIRAGDFTRLAPGEEMAGQAALDVSGYHLSKVGAQSMFAVVWVYSGETGKAAGLKAWTGTLKSERRRVALNARS